jgi:hypothetical protein
MSQKHSDICHFSGNFVPDSNQIQTLMWYNVVESHTKNLHTINLQEEGKNDYIPHAFLQLNKICFDVGPFG